MFVTVPFVPFVTLLTDKLSPSISVSFVRTSIITAVSSNVFAESSLATGASFAGVTVITAEPTSERSPSDTVKSKE